MVVAELVDGCNLACELCWNKNRKGTFKQMSLSTVDKILKKYSGLKGESITWFNWGEPLLYKEFDTFSEMVKGTRSVISSNFSLPISDRRFKSLNNIHTVIVSLSGMIRDVYSIYHKRGDFDLVMSNIKKLRENREGRIILRWLRHSYNEFQFQQAQEFAKENGMKFEPTDLCCQVEDSMSQLDHELLKHPKFDAVKKRCRQLDWTVIDVDGNHLLCCATHNVKTRFTIDDDISHSELKDVKRSTEICRVCQKEGLWRMY